MQGWILTSPWSDSPLLAWICELRLRAAIRWMSGQDFENLPTDILDIFRDHQPSQITLTRRDVRGTAYGSCQPLFMNIEDVTLERLDSRGKRLGVTADEQDANKLLHRQSLHDFNEEEVYTRHLFHRQVILLHLRRLLLYAREERRLRYKLARIL